MNEGVCVGGELDGQRVPACPECGGAAVLLEVGVETIVSPGMVPVRARPSRQGPQARCAEGHWFTLDGLPSPGPISYTVEGVIAECSSCGWRGVPTMLGGRVVRFASFDGPRVIPTDPRPSVPLDRCPACQRAECLVPMGVEE